MANVRAVGIDLGTSNSAAAWVDESGRTAMVRNAEGDLLTPSVVLFDDTEVVVGKEARRSAAVHPDWVAQWVKRDMGSPAYSRLIRGERLPPEVIQACILRKFRADVAAALGPATKVVLTVPAYFDELRRKATADAGEMAGLSLLDIVNEPTAAALGFGEILGYLSAGGKARDEMVVMVYDLGGGTFDATMLRLSPGEFRTLATDGDVQLGGHDWDGRLVDYAAEVFRNRHGQDPREDPAALARLYDAAVEAKHALSARSQATIRVEHGGHVLDVPVAREQFEELSADLLERTAYTSRQLLAEAGLRWQDVSRVLLVGGSTRMPMVPRMLQQMTGIAPDRTVNPDEAVARGAALYAHYLLRSPEHGGPGASFEVTNVNSHSLGIEGIDPLTLRKINVVLIRRNTSLPARRTEKFTTKTEGQRSIVLQVLEGESNLPGDCTMIGRTVIRDLPALLPKGWPIEVTFEYAANGRLAVRAVVPGTNREVTLDLERDVGLSREGISRWKRAVSASSAVGFDQFESLIDEALHLERGEQDDLPALRSESPGQAGPAGWELSPAEPRAPGIMPQPSPIVPQPSPIASPPSPIMSQPSPLFSEPSPMASAASPVEPPASPGGAPRSSYFSGPLPLDDLAEGETGRGAGADWPPEGVPEAAFRPVPPRRQKDQPGGGFPRWVISLIGYGLSAIAGITLGYFLIRWIFPEAQLPGY